MREKQIAAIAAAQLVEPNMIVGLGTGSTATFMIEELGRRVQEEGLNITGVATSIATEKQAQAVGIPLKPLDAVPYLDLTIDGADEISVDFQGIKGGGGALLFEKIVATYSKEIIWIADSSKLVAQLGAFPLPVEVVPFGYQHLLQSFETDGLSPRLRTNPDSTAFVTDSGHYIIDLNLYAIEDPIKLATYLENKVGVVEHGLFINLVSKVIIGAENQAKVLTAPVKFSPPF